MLSIAAMGAHSESYYIDLAREDYYLNGGEPPGVWFGRGAEHFALSGTVDKEAFRNLFHGRGPAGTKLTQNAGKPSHHPGWDLTFSAPKSVSVLWSQADPETRALIQKAHEEAVQDALGYLERVAGYTKRERGGLEKEEAFGLVAATFEHGTSRAQEPQLHTHAIVFNVAPRYDGSTGTLLGRPLFTHKMTAGALYRAGLAFRLQERLGLAVERNKNLFELRGVPAKALDFFSTRRKEILAAMDKLSASGPKAAARLALTTRKAKGHLARGSLFEGWRAGGLAHGFSTAEVSKLLGQNIRRGGATKELAKALAATTTELTAQESYFTDSKFVRRLAEAAPGRGFGAEELLRAASDYLAQSPNIRRLGRIDGEALFTTKEVLETEKRMLSAVDASRGKGGHTVSPKTLLRAIREVEKKNGYELSEEQNLAAAHLTLHPGSIKVIQGLAGTGKTALLQAARKAWEAEGYEVHGAAVAGIAKRRLQDETGIQSDTLAKRLKDLAPLDIDYERFDSLKQQWAYVAAAKKNRFKMNSKTILVVDEAGMVDTPQMAKLIEHARKAKAKLVLVGDAGQLQPIETGGAFPAIAERIGQAKLTDIRRQGEQWARKAVKDIASGDSAATLRAYAARGLLRVEDSREAAIDQLISDWKEKAVSDPQKALILCGTRRDTATLNARAQAARREAGQLGSASTTIGGVEVFENDRIVLTKRFKQRGIENGDTGTIRAIHSLRLHPALDISFDDGRSLRLSLHDYDSIQLGYATTTHKAQGATVDSAFVLLGGPMQDRELSYVQLSRARGETRLYSEKLDVGDTVQELSKVAEKSRKKLLAHDVLEQARNETQHKEAPAKERSPQPEARPTPARPIVEAQLEELRLPASSQELREAHLRRSKTRGPRRLPPPPLPPPAPPTHEIGR